MSAYAANAAAGWGSNGSGQLGDGTTAEKSVPVNVAGLSEVKQVAAGGDHTLALMENGTVKAWGANGCGQLGNGTTTSSSTPVTVEGLTEVASVAAESGYSFAVLKSGAVKSWGCGAGNVLGDGSTANRTTPGAVSGLSSVVSIAAGGRHVLAVTEGGHVYAWGTNNSGDLGNGSYTEGASEPVEVSGITEAKSVAAGEIFSLALLTSGKIDSWGDDEWGGLGIGSTETSGKCKHSAEWPFRCSDTPLEVSGISTATQIAAYGNNAFARLEGGTVKAWGENANGELGIGTNKGPDECLLEFYVTEFGYEGWYVWPAACATSPVTVPELSGVTALAAGHDHTLALLSGGQVDGWGPNITGTKSSFRYAPSPVPGVGEVQSVAAGGGDSFTIGPPLPTVTGVSPGTGYGTGGETVTVTGTNLTAATAVKFGQTAAPHITVNSSTSITATTPSHRPASLDVTVVASGATSATSSADTFTFIPEVLGLGRCVNVGPGAGAYKTGTCGSPLAEGRYQWYPGVAKTGITFTNGTETVEKVEKPHKVLFETTGKTQLLCTGLSGTGNYSGTSILTGASLKFTGCEMSGSKCSSGAVSGEIVTEPVGGSLGWREKAGNLVGESLAPSSESGPLFEATCGTATVAVTGSAIGQITPANNMTLSFSLKLKQSKGVQAVEAFEGEEAQTLRMSINKGSSVQTGVSLEAIQTGEEELEINTVI
ncbi:MAG TPA: IPT/TIG domain-containing protein [Solirubrobacteraceae bacterium]|nr:IPT/TIG domain-containing protein [Solirubrobacteraceae bacterium]